MGYLVLVRHGQARSFEKDGDRLSPLGEEQARALARYWVRQGVNFDEVYSGALVRQRRTAEIAEECFVQSGLAWPRLQTMPELNEYDAIGIINNLIPSLAERDAAFRALAEESERNKDTPERNRHFQRMFAAVTSVWLGGEFEVEGVESWRSLQSRVRAAIKHIASAEGRGRRVAVFTSGGVIGLAVQNVLNAPERSALEINWRVRNCSLTGFMFRHGRMSVGLFNVIIHSDDLCFTS